MSETDDTVTPETDEDADPAFSGHAGGGYAGGGEAIVDGEIVTFDAEGNEVARSGTFGQEVDAADDDDDV
jgi:hypothetical protein